MNLRDLAAVVAIVATPLSASAEHREFGEQGVLNVAAATGLDLKLGSIKPREGDSAGFQHFRVTPSVDYFVVDNLSIGAIFTVERTLVKPANGDADTSTTLGFGPRIGYNIWLSPGLLSLWPSVSFLYQSQSFTTKAVDGGTRTLGTLGLFVPLMIHPVPHFYLAVGPQLDVDVVSRSKLPNTDAVDGDKRTSFGIAGQIGGWF